MEEIKKVSEKGLKFLVKEEGVILHPYKDSVGVWTIGVGCTYYENGKRVQEDDPPITLEQAYSLFSEILSFYEKSVWSLTRDDISQSQFDALVSLCFNIGVNHFKTSTALAKVNANPEDNNIAIAFKMWRNAGNKKGILLERRIRETDLYFS